MEHQLAVLPLIEPVDEVDVKLRILCIGDVEGHILPQLVLRRVEDVGTEVEQVACRLYIRLDGRPSVVIGIAEADLHDEQVLVVVFQNGVRVRIVRQVLVAEGIADPGHEHIVQVDQVQSVAVQAVLPLPLIVPTGREHAAVELRTVLRVVHQRHLAAGDDAPAVAGTQEGADEPGERQAALQAVFEEVLVAVALQSPDGLVGTAQLHAQHLRPPEQVPVLVRQRDRRSQVARRVGAFRLETDGRGFVRLYQHLRIQECRAGYLLVVDVRELHGIQAAEVVVRLPEVRRRVRLSRLDEGVLFQHVAAQMDRRVGHAAHKTHVADEVLRVQRAAVCCRTVVGMQHERHVHHLLLVIPAGTIGDELLMETEVAAVLQIRRDLVALLAQGLGAELLGGIERTVATQQQLLDQRVLNLRLILAYPVRRPWPQQIDGIALPLLIVHIQRHLRIQIAFVLQSLFQVLAALPGQQRVEHHGRLAHRPQGTVHPRAVAPGQRIDAQWHLHRRQPARVALLSHVVLHRQCVDVLIVSVRHHTDLVEHIRAFWQMTRSRAAAQEQRSRDHRQPLSHHPDFHLPL